MKKRLIFLNLLCLTLFFSACSKQDNEVKLEELPETAIIQKEGEDIAFKKDTPAPFCPCNKRTHISIRADSNLNDEGTATVFAYDAVNNRPSSCPGFSVDYDYNGGGPTVTTDRVKGHTSGLVYAVQNSSGENAFMRFTLTAPNGSTYSTGFNYVSPGELVITDLPYPCVPFEN